MLSRLVSAVTKQIVSTLGPQVLGCCVKELNLNYHNPETILFAIYIHIMVT